MLFTAYHGTIVGMEILRVVFCFDENLVTQVQAAAASLLDARGLEEHFEIHCVCTKAAGIAAKPLEQVIKRRDSASGLVMHCVDNPYEKAYQVRDISAGTYLRLALPELLPEADRILYMDADVLVRESLAPLWETPLEGKALAAVKGAVNLSEKWEWNSDRPYWHLLSGAKGGYINAGVTLLNLAEVRERGLAARWHELTGERFYYQDQDILNMTCQGAIAYLTPKYNRLAYLEEQDFDQFVAEGIYTQEEKREALRSPAIIHYAGDKPWKRYDTNLGSLWWAYVNAQPDLKELFDEEKARRYHGPTLAQRAVRKVKKVFGREKI
ncbi:MAG: glycosyltransferase family 8 protein [Lachnospiraceae bacterium]|nr:glycosyltransferase family 8 protein [Lachnospiraceae bacterium]